jgi:hypothetical protein
VNVNRRRWLLIAGTAAIALPAGIVLGSRLGDSMDVPDQAATTGQVTPTGSGATGTTQVGPRLSVPDATISPGETFEVKGTGFQPFRSGTVTMNGVRISNVRTTKGGRFSLSVEAPTDARGDVRVVATVGGATAAASLSLAPTSARPAPTPPKDTPAGSVVVMAVGDLTSSATDRDALAVRDVVAAERPARILMLGDYQYKYGSSSAIKGGADNLWGPKPGGLWATMMPTSGPTHDVTSCKPSDYDRYWERSAMKPYSFTLGSWHIIQLPSAVYRYDCDPSGVLAWLRADLASHRTGCTLAFWHEPYWTRTTAEHGRTRAVKPWVDMLYDAGVEVVLNGHQHNYQRFEPQNPSDQIDRARGIRSFVVGSGGIGFYPFTGPDGNAAASTAATYGALKLVLRRGAYDWKFIRAGGAEFSDAGTATCH